MSKEQRRQQPLVTHSDSDTDDPERPHVAKHKFAPKFNHGDNVYIRATSSSAREGPYKIEVRVMDSEITSYKYTLCDVETKATAKDGRKFSERELEPVA